MKAYEEYKSWVDDKVDKNVERDYGKAGEMLKERNDMEASLLEQVMMSIKDN